MKRSGEKDAIPDGWQQVRLGDVASLRKGQIEPKKNDSTPYIGLEHIESSGFLIAHGKAGNLLSNKTIFHRGDTLYGKLRPNLRKVIRADFDGVCSTDILAIFGNGITDDRFLGQLLRGDLLHEHAMRGISGTKMPRTSWSHLQDFEFTYPPLLEQRAIAAVLDSIDDAIEGAEAVIAATERLRDALVYDLLTRGLPGQHTEWRDVPGLGSIPADWDVVRLGDVYEVQLGKMLSPKAKQGTNPKPYLTNRNVRWGDFDLRDLPEMDFNDREIGKFQLRPGDLMVCEGGETGRAAVWAGEIADCYYQKALHRLRPKDQDGIPKFMLAVLMFYERKGILMEHSERTSISHLTRERLLRMPIPNPPRPDQSTIASTLDGVGAAVEVAREELGRLRLMKESAAEALLAGQARVEGRK